MSFEEIEKMIGQFVVGQKSFLEDVDFVVGVSRGGLVPAALLAAKIDKPLVAAYINKKDEIFFDRPDWIKDKNILVVDDIVRSGKTLWILKNHLEKNCAPKSVSFFTLFKVKPSFNEDFNVNMLTNEIDEDTTFPWDN